MGGQCGSCTKMVYNRAMAQVKRASKKKVRRSISLPADVERQVHSLAKRHRLSENRVLIELIEQGIEARKHQEKAFFDAAERFRSASRPEDVKQMGDELGRFIFGE